MNKIHYQIVVNESGSEFLEVYFCQTKINFSSENPMKARNQALNYLFQTKQAGNWTRDAFFQLYLVYAEDDGQEESIVLANGYQKSTGISLKEDNLKREKELYRIQRMASQLPQPVW